MKNLYDVKPRSGCKDVWNAFMVKGAIFSDNDIPFCPTTARDIPTKIITIFEAERIYKEEISKGNHKFKRDEYVSGYEDDHLMDRVKEKNIWLDSKYLCEILDHFEGLITIDWSTYMDFPYPIKLFNTYRMRAFGRWYGEVRHKNVINNVRWGTPETYDYCFDGLPKNSIVCIGCVASKLKNKVYRQIFHDGLREMIKRIHPFTILVYGAIDSESKEIIKNAGIVLYIYPSRKSQVHCRKET